MALEYTLKPQELRTYTWLVYGSCRNFAGFAADIAQTEFIVRFLTANHGRCRGGAC